ncbi:TetR/AcrR family transcriptional regulator [Rhizobium calliandrae]|uniref:TetR/AcrR family transcriptional regulator n=1 Tax=Rhizobium calliandrae TaxID=1312182 RepID=A0ABT7K9C6_9HYPH|nr:TetR/AcrR family transcriptional regulator [Rhizobium calliandrae]MDL2404747.1 TetR/AcrR family transcriptional regulator [Rhizobium calliandrae]
MYTWQPCCKFSTPQSRRFEREGPTGVSMGTIAKDVGLTAMAIYRHYPDNEALMNALILNGMSAWEEWLRNPIHGSMRRAKHFLLSRSRSHHASTRLPSF